MSNPLVTILFILSFVLVAGLFIGLTVWALRKMKKEDAALSEGSQQRGWQYQRDTRHYGYQIQGQSESTHWKLYARTSKSRTATHSSSTTHWSTDDFQIPHLELLVRTRADYAAETSMLGRSAMAVVGGVMSLLSGAKSEHGDLYKTGKHLGFHSPPLKGQYVVITRDTALVSRLLDDSVKDCLVRWQTSTVLPEETKDTLHIDVGQPNLYIYVNDRLETIEAVAQLVELGVTLARNYQKSYTP